MFLEERQIKMLEYINEKQKVSTKKLSEVFKTSVVTIRKDINELYKRGLVLTVHGGVLAYSDKLNLEIPSNEKARLNIEDKKAIGRLAAELIENNDVIILDSGSTTYEVGLAIGKKKVTVITNDIKIAFSLANKPNITLVMPGGTTEKNLYTLCGIETINFFRNIRADKLFLGCDAIDFKTGITNRTLLEIGAKRAMIDVSKKVIAVADKSKHDKEVFAHLCDINEIDVLVTNSISSENKEIAESVGLRVITPPEQENGKKTQES